MGTPHDHPYVIDIRPSPGVPGHFTWSIHEKRAPRRRSRTSYPSFEEARRAAQATLAHLIFEHWLIGSKDPHRAGRAEDPDLGGLAPAGP